MELNKKFLNLVVSLILLVVLLVSLIGFVSAIKDLVAFQGNVKQSGVDLSSGDLNVTIYNASTGGTLIYAENFTDAVVNGKYDVMLGEDGDANTELHLEYGRLYYIDMIVNGEDFDYGIDERQVFQAGTGNISLNDLDFSDGQNISLTSEGGWFKGFFDLVIDSVSTNYLSFNGSALTLNETHLNLSILNFTNGSYVPYTGATDNVNLTDKNLTTTGIISGGWNSSFGGANQYWEVQSLSIVGQDYPMLTPYSDGVFTNNGVIANSFFLYDNKDGGDVSIVFTSND